MGSDSALQLTFKNLPFLWYNTKKYLQLSEKTMKMLLFHLHVCVMLDFLRVPPPKQHIATDGMQK